jgi:hypothetical protein
VYHPDVSFVQLPEGVPVARPGGGDKRDVRGDSGSRGSHSQSLIDQQTRVNPRDGLHGGKTVQAAEVLAAQMLLSAPSWNRIKSSYKAV